MEYSDFERFYDVVIREFMIELEEKDEPYHSLTFYERRRKLVYDHYEKKRLEIRTKYMKQTEDLALDRHKVASCMMYALLRGKLIEVDPTVPGLPEELVLANEYLAFTVALNIVEMYKESDRSENEPGLQPEGTVYNLMIPQTYHDVGSKSDFVPNMCKSLRFVKDLKHYDVFAYATILFLLESRTDSILLCSPSPSSKKADPIANGHDVTEK